MEPSFQSILSEVFKKRLSTSGKKKKNPCYIKKRIGHNKENCFYEVKLSEKIKI